MSQSDDMAARLAGELERGGGLACGACGKPHASSSADWEHGGWCYCRPCCGRYLEEWIAADFPTSFPDLVDHRGNITEAAIDEAIRRLEREVAERGS
jgi:hypothetical protein